MIVVRISLESEILDGDTPALWKENRKIRPVVDVVPAVVALVLVIDVILEQRVGDEVFAELLDVVTSERLSGQRTSVFDEFFDGQMEAALDDAIPILAEVPQHQIPDQRPELVRLKMFINHSLNLAAEGEIP